VLARSRHRNDMSIKNLVVFKHVNNSRALPTSNRGLAADFKPKIRGDFRRLWRAISRP
jgi:hypothetical protein